MRQGLLVWVTGALSFGAPAIRAQARTGGAADTLGRGDSAAVALRRAPNVTVIDGATLRRSGAVSLGEALAGKVAGLDVITGPGTFGGLPQVRLRGTSTFVGYDAPLVLVDDVPARIHETIRTDVDAVEDRVAPVLLTDVPLADVERVEVLRGTAAAAYGPMAAGGVIRVVTRRAPGRRVDWGVSQHAGIADPHGSLASRAISREEAMTQRLYRLNLAPQQRAASWDSCQGSCGAFDALFGGTRRILATDAWAGGRSSTTGWTLGGTWRQRGVALRRVDETYVAGRASVEQSIGGRVTLRATQLVSHTSDEQPLLSLDLPALYGRPEWLNLRGAAGSYDGLTIPANALVSLDSNRTPRVQRQYLSSLRADARVWTRGATTLSLHVTGGHHRAVRSDTFDVAQLFGSVAPLFIRQRMMQKRSARASFLAANVQLAATLAGARSTTSLGVERTGRGYAVKDENLDSPSLATTTLITGTNVAVIAAQHWSVASDRGQLDLAYRRDNPGHEAGIADVQHGWRAGVVFDAWRDRARVLQLQVGAAQAQWSPLSESGVVPIGWVIRQPLDDPRYDLSTPETRRTFDAGARLSLADGRVRLGAAGFVTSTTDAFVPMFYAVPGPGFTAALVRGRLRTTGYELELHATPIATGPSSWTASVLAWHSRANVRSTGIISPPFGVRVTYGGRLLEDDTPLFRIAQRDALHGGAIRTVGDGDPTLSFAQRNDVRWRRFRLTTQLDGQLGGDVVNETQYLRDAYSLSPDAPDGGFTRWDEGSAGIPHYVQRGGYAQLREVTLSFDLAPAGAGRIFTKGARLELGGRNLATWSSLDVLDPAARTTSLPTDVARISAPLTPPPLRQLTLALILGR